MARDLLSERMAERVLGLRIQRRLQDELGVAQLPQRLIDLGFGPVGGGDQQVAAKVLADRGGRLQDVLGLRTEAVDARGKDRVDSRRHRDVVDLRHEPVAARLALERSGLGELADDLFDEERVALASSHRSSR